MPPVPTERRNSMYDGGIFYKHDQPDYFFNFIMFILYIGVPIIIGFGIWYAFNYEEVCVSFIKATIP
jgi:hypothetical protein